MGPGRGWFEVSEAGWAARARSRSLGRLLLEALQNALDGQASSIQVTTSERQIWVEDDANGIADPTAIYTLFLSDKGPDPSQRGRLGRGLKELIASMERAEVHVPGLTIEFERSGRHSRPNERTEGTLLVLERDYGDRELELAVARLRTVIPPPGVSLRVDGKLVRRPPRLLELLGCELETLSIVDGIETRSFAPTTISVHARRRAEQPHIYELGIPVQSWNVPWHVNVGQRVPIHERRDQLPERYRLALQGMLLEAMIHSYLEPRDLRADWVHQAIAQANVRAGVLDAYVSKVFPRRAVLPGDERDDDRARQLGAHVIDTDALPSGTLAALGRVLETARTYAERREHELGGADVTPNALHERFATAVCTLAMELTGRRITVSFFAREARADGLIEDALTDAALAHLRFNVHAGLDFGDVLEPRTFGIVLHELAHLDTPLHDRRFVDRLQQLAGRVVHLFAERPALAKQLRAQPSEQ